MGADVDASEVQKQWGEKHRLVVGVGEDEEDVALDIWAVAPIGGSPEVRKAEDCCGSDEGNEKHNFSNGGGAVSFLAAFAAAAGFASCAVLTTTSISAVLF